MIRINYIYFGMLCTTLLQAGWCVAQNTDIEFVHGSFLGGNGLDLPAIPNSLVVDAEGNILFASSTTSNNMPLTGDAHQSSLSGFKSFYITKLSASGELLYATYFGGSTGDAAALDIASTGHVVLAGQAQGPGFPVTPNAHQQDYPGGIRSGTLTLFNESFDLEWSTYMGGADIDAISSVVLNDNQEVFVSGSTKSPGLSTPGAHAEINDQDEWSGFLAKFTSEGILSYYTYFQGNGSTFFRSSQLSSDGSKIYLLGRTNATSGIAFGGVANVYQGGEGDAFIACFDIDANEFIWSRYFGGPGNELPEALALGPQDQIVIYGSTWSTTGISTPGAHQEAPTNQSTGPISDNNRFIAVFDNEGNIEWATYFGGTPPGGANSGLSVNGNEIVVNGFARGQEAILLGNPIEDEILEAGSYFIAKFNLDSGSQVWGTYIGNGTDAWLVDVIHLPDDRLFTFGIAASQNAAISLDALQSQFGGDVQDLYYAIFQDISLNTIDLKNKENLRLFPNPACTRVRLALETTSTEQWHVSLFDISGRTLLSAQLSNVNEPIDIHFLPVGMYIVKATSGTFLKTAKLIVER